MIATLPLRTSCLIERAHACAAGFDAIGRTFSADLTCGFALNMEAGAPSALYEHWIGEQVARLRSMSQRRRSPHGVI